MDGAVLPPRDPDAEEAFVAWWRDHDDLDGLIDMITSAVEARRPQLAARLVGLVPEDAEPPDEETTAALIQARRAASFLLHDRLRPEDVSWSELEDAWAVLRRKRMQRIRRRWRMSQSGRYHRTGRLKN